MSRITYVKKKFRGESLQVIREANAICAQYQAQGFDLTLRQLYYQFVARGLIPNNQESYDRLGRIVSDARLAGYMDWDYIVDRTRNLRSLPHWNSPAEIVEAVSRQYRIEKWADQPVRIEVWIEKDALVGVLDSVCPGLDVDYFSCRGYTSQSEIWGAAQRLREYLNAGQRVVVLHLGDHDPSGIDMTRDIRDRLELFIGKDWYREHAGEDDLEWIDEDDPDEWEMYEAEVWQHINDHLMIPADDIRAVPPLIVSRIALNMPQVQQYNPPPNFAKPKDARTPDYIRRFNTTDSWELDALDPATLAALIQAAVESFRDPVKWQAAEAKEDEEKSVLKEASDRWTEVTSFLNGEDAA